MSFVVWPVDNSKGLRVANSLAAIDQIEEHDEFDDSVGLRLLLRDVDHAFYRKYPSREARSQAFDEIVGLKKAEPAKDVVEQGCGEVAGLTRAIVSLSGRNVFLTTKTFNDVLKFDELSTVATFVLRGSIEESIEILRLWRREYDFDLTKAINDVAEQYREMARNATAAGASKIVTQFDEIVEELKDKGRTMRDASVSIGDNRLVLSLWGGDKWVEEDCQFGLQSVDFNFAAKILQSWSEQYNIVSPGPEGAIVALVDFFAKHGVLRGPTSTLEEVEIEAGNSIVYLRLRESGGRFTVLRIVTSNVIKAVRRLVQLRGVYSFGIVGAVRYVVKEWRVEKVIDG